MWLTASVTDESGHKQETVAGFLGRVYEAREYVNNSTVIYSKAAYSYDELDRQTAITVISGAAPGQAQTQSFVYDGYGRVQSQTTPEGGTVTYAYYDNDQVQSVSDARGMVTTYSYNTRKLVTGVSYNDGGATPGVSYSYDEWGARSQMNDGQGTTSYSYNGMRQVQSETRTLTGLPGESYTLGYSYNLAGQVTRLTYNATNFSKNISYAYTSAGALSGVGTNLIGTDPNATSNVVSLTGYLAFGATTSATYGNGRTLAMSYSEQRHQLTSMIVQRSDGSDRIVDKGYDYYDTNQANTGRLMKQTDHLDPAYSVTYAYDGVNRLSSAQAGSVDTVKGYDRVYSYDEWGNLRTVSGDSDGTSATQFNYTYNYAVNGTGAPATNRLTDVNGVPYSYDAAGNLTSDGVISYTYDAANRMKTSNGGQSLYYYDGDGHRVRRDFPGTSPLFYVWSSVLGNVAMEVRPQTVVRAYVYAGGSPVALQNWDGTFVWIHKDHLGSTSLLTKTDGSVACKTQFDPSGQQVMLWVNPVGGTSISQGFTGYEKDNPTGLYNARARMYSYGQARFLQPDPLGVGAANPAKPQSFNRYSYVGNDPVNFVDPSGMFMIPGICVPILAKGEDGQIEVIDYFCGGGEDTGGGDDSGDSGGADVTCTIELRGRETDLNIGGILIFRDVHTYILVTQSDKPEGATVYQGWGSHERQPDGSESFFIRAYSSVYTQLPPSRAADYQPNYSDHGFPAKVRLPGTCDGVTRKFNDAIDKINSKNIPFDILNATSNSVAYTLLRTLFSDDQIEKSSITRFVFRKFLRIRKFHPPQYMDGSITYFHERQGMRVVRYLAALIPKKEPTLGQVNNKRIKLLICLSAVTIVLLLGWAAIHTKTISLSPIDRSVKSIAILAKMADGSTSKEITDPNQISQLVGYANRQFVKRQWYHDCPTCIWLEGELLNKRTYAGIIFYTDDGDNRSIDIGVGYLYTSQHFPDHIDNHLANPPHQEIAELLRLAGISPAQLQ